MRSIAKRGKNKIEKAVDLMLSHVEKILPLGASI